MTAEVVNNLGAAIRTIPSGESVIWVSGGTFFQLASYANKQGFTVFDGGNPDPDKKWAFTQENRREFILPTGERVIPR
jgi:hypothetical protein